MQLISNYYDDNFGLYRIEDEDDLEFYREIQRNSVWKRCEGCGREVRLRPDYGYCNSCMERLEAGFDV